MGLIRLTVVEPLLIMVLLLLLLYLCSTLVYRVFMPKSCTPARGKGCLVALFFVLFDAHHFLFYLTPWVLQLLLLPTNLSYSRSISVAVDCSWIGRYTLSCNGIRWRMHILEFFLYIFIYIKGCCAHKSHVTAYICTSTLPSPTFRDTNTRTAWWICELISASQPLLLVRLVVWRWKWNVVVYGRQGLIISKVGCLTSEVECSTTTITHNIRHVLIIWRGLHCLYY